MNNFRIRLEPKGNYLKQYRVTFTPNNVVNLFTVYEIDTWSQDLYNGFNLKDCLFGSVKLTKNADPDKDKYRGYGTGFYYRSKFSLTDGSVGKNIIILGVHMNSYVHIDNNNKDILIIGKGQIMT